MTKSIPTLTTDSGENNLDAYLRHVTAIAKPGMKEEDYQAAKYLALENIKVLAQLQALYPDHAKEIRNQMSKDLKQTVVSNEDRRLIDILNVEMNNKGAVSPVSALNALERAKEVHEERCATCHTPNRAISKKEYLLQRCQKCQKAMYCSRDCQIKDWKNHKVQCYSQNR